MISSTKQSGFTIIELMIASTIFSVILLMCSFAIMQIGRVYYKGVNIVRTQSVTRSVSDNVAQAIQFSGSDFVAPNKAGANLSAGSNGAVCIGTRRYSYIKNRVLVDGTPNGTETNAALIVDNAPPSGCSPIGSVAAGSDARELLSENMRLTDLSIVETGAGYEVTVWVTLGALDLSDGSGGETPGQCRGGTESQFCAYSRLTTLAKRRI